MCKYQKTLCKNSANQLFKDGKISHCICKSISYGKSLQMVFNTGQIRNIGEKFAEKDLF